MQTIVLSSTRGLRLGPALARVCVYTAPDVAAVSLEDRAEDRTPFRKDLLSRKLETSAGTLKLTCTCYHTSQSPTF